jgi:hypothetical protein
MEYVLEIDRNIQLSAYGIRELQHLSDLKDARKKAKIKFTPYVDAWAITKTKKGRTKSFTAIEVSTIAREECDRGFPLLVRLSIVGLWSALEVAIPSFVKTFLEEKPELLGAKAFEKVKLPAALCRNLSAEDFYSLVIDEFERDTSGILKAGIGRFENLLSTIGCTGEVEKEIRDNIYELSRVRNLIVHNFGRADKKFLKECPAFDVKLGAQVKLTLYHYHTYAAAVHGYAANVIERIQKVRESHG